MQTIRTRFSARETRVDEPQARRGKLARRTIAALAVVVCGVLVATPAGGVGARGVAPTGSANVATLPDGESAVYATSAPSVENLLYVVAKGGSIYSLDVGQSDPTPQPFLRLKPSTVSTDGERGLLSVAFAPDFETSRLLYVYFTDARGDIEIDEYRAPTDTQADRSTRRKVISIPHRRNSNHNGGTAAFGPDGLLYIGTGDGGAGGDPPENAQNKKVLLGKLLRIDPARSGRRPYTAPASNPFAGERKGRAEIFALGLRNPFRFSFDGETAWIGDVGQSAREEVDKAGPGRLRGANFGWDRWEGTLRYRDSSDPSSPRPKAADHARPYHEYPHSDGCSITGGVVAPAGASAGGIAGRYVYADFCAGKLFSLPTDGPNGSPADVTARDEGLDIDSPTSFAAGPDGEVYVTRLGGAIVQLVGRSD